jgi:hypothetical protein
MEMKTKIEDEPKKTANVDKFSEEELKLREKTLSRTAPEVDQTHKSFDPVKAPMQGGMIGTASGENVRIEPPTGKDIDLEALEHRDKALRNAPSDTDPSKKHVQQITAPEKGGMR